MLPPTAQKRVENTANAGEFFNKVGFWRGGIFKHIYIYIYVFLYSIHIYIYMYTCCLHCALSRFASAISGPLAENLSLAPSAGRDLERYAAQLKASKEEAGGIESGSCENLGPPKCSWFAG